MFSYNSEGACEECGGKRFKREVLEYSYKNKSMVEVLAMRAAEVIKFFVKKEIINFEGTPADLKNCKESITASYF